VNITPVISGSVFHHWVKKKFIGESRGTRLKIVVQIRYCSIPLFNISNNGIRAIVVVLVNKILCMFVFIESK
jgi:hypothetical protein